MKVKIYRNRVTNSIDILFYDERDGKKYIVKPVEIIFEEICPGQPREPTITIPQEFDEDYGFLKAFADEFDRIGIETDKDARIKGTLDATKYHLEDLRKLLKLNKDV